MNLLNITTVLTPINEFGQNPAHNEFNVWVSFLLLFLWPLLIFISYKFISYTMRKLESIGYFEDETDKNVVETEKADATA
jgi:hypothetical protein